MTRPTLERSHALKLHELGFNTCEIARTTGVPRTTVRCWISPRPKSRQAADRSCFRCDEDQAISTGRYCYLLGLYLGDGYIVRSRVSNYRLRIYQDQRYINLISQCDEAIYVICAKQARHIRKDGCVAISAHWKHWCHVFPQHGKGMKHTRPMQLEPWQQEFVQAEPKRFLAGLIHSDGSRAMNTIAYQTRAGEQRRYSYPRYQFTNTSSDIRKLFTDTCELLGVRWTQANARNVSVARAADVAFLDTFIGPKS